MRRWSEVAGRVAATTKTSEKTALLADYLRGLSPDELPVAAVFLTGRPFAEADQRSIGLGWSAMATAIAEIAGVDRDALGAAYDRHSDLGLAVEDVLVGVGHAPPPEVSPTLPEVAAAFAAIEAASGPAKKVAILRPILERSDPATVKGIVKVLGGDLRIGLREGLLEAAIAKAFDRPLDDVKWAGMLTGDVGRLASLARDDRLADAEMTVFQAIRGDARRTDIYSTSPNMGRGRQRHALTTSSVVLVQRRDLGTLRPEAHADPVAAAPRCRRRGAPARGRRTVPSGWRAYQFLSIEGEAAV